MITHEILLIYSSCKAQNKNNDKKRDIDSKPREEKIIQTLTRCEYILLKVEKKTGEKILTNGKLPVGNYGG